MLHGVFRTKEGKIITIILALIIIAGGIFAFINYRGNRQFVEQAVMAENYLRAGNYEQAVDAYLKAMAMKNSNNELLSLGLADSYAGLNKYDQALTILRSCYQKTSGIKIKEKIEEISSMKTDYEYLQSASRAEVYFNNKEYSKAITEYENAKLIKSKEVTSYKRIAEAYIEKGEYNLALEEVLEGQALTGNKELEETLALVESYLKKEQYDDIVAEASEYIYQENYTDGVSTYEEAISLLPMESAAYKGLAEAFGLQEEYDKEVLILKKALKLIDNEELEVLYAQAVKLQAEAEERNTILTQLIKAMQEKDPIVIITLLQLSFFEEKIPEDKPVFFGIEDDKDESDIGLIVYTDHKAYYGEVYHGLKQGKGYYFMLSQCNGETSYYLYDGEWVKDMPSGVGRLEEENVLLDQAGEKYTSKIVTEGSFDVAVENGTMTKIFYRDGVERGRLQYQSIKGIPQPTKAPYAQPSPVPGTTTLVIGELLRDGLQTGEFYRVETEIILGVKPFIKNK